MFSLRIKRGLVRHRSKIRAFILHSLETLGEELIIPRGARKWFPIAPDQRAVGQKVLFVGYGGPVGRLGHKIVAQHLRNLGGQADHVLPSDVSSLYSRAWTKDIDGPGRLFETASDLTDYLVEAAKGDYFFKRGLIDEYVRRAPRNFFIGRNWLPDSFLDMAHSVLDEIKRTFAEYSSLVLVDEGYLQKSCLLSAAKSQAKPVWTLKPSGEWERIDDVDFDADGKSLFLQAQEWSLNRPEVILEARRYAQDRFSGNVTSDIDAHFVYGSNASNGQEEPRKILFLHAIRDASGLPLRDTRRGHLFASFLEWASQAMEYIAENPASWWIKPHPQLILFPDESKIVEELMDVHSIPREILRADLDTRWALTNRLPIYTHSGTIAIEAATHGYRAHVCSTIYSEQMSHISLTLDEMAANYLLPLEKAATPITEARDIDLARVMLLDRFPAVAKELAPAFVSYSRSSVGSAELAARRQTMDLLWRYRKQLPHATAHRIAREIVSESSID